MIRWIHRAKYLLSEANQVQENGAVHVTDDGRIVRIGPWNGSETDQAEVLDWGCAVIVPGFVNAHAHLELTFLRNQLQSFSSFADWVQLLLHRRASCSRRQLLDSARSGAQLAMDSGTTLLGDIASSGVSFEALKGFTLRRVIFEEAIGLDPRQAEQTTTELAKRLDALGGDSRYAPAISPHAPYSVSGELYRNLAELAAKRGLLLATHVAETKEELEFLQNGSGSLRELLLKVGAYPPGWSAPALHPIQHLAELGVLEHPTLLIHANYLNEESVNTILKKRTSVVYCPRSHAFFGHEEHPVRLLLDRGVNVALGTDSLASNSSLSMLDEMRFLFRKRKDVKPVEILAMATMNGASALQLGNATGRLQEGYWADMAVLSLTPDSAPKNLLIDVLDGAGDCLATVVGGIVAKRSTG